jgi:O-methyltransferase
MDNFFLTEYFDWRIKRFSLMDRVVFRVLSKLLGKTEFRSAAFFDNIYTKLTGNEAIPSTSGVMTNIEQRINMYHLVSQVLAYGVEGDFVELGCNAGDSLDSNN